MFGIVLCMLSHIYMIIFICYTHIYIFRMHQLVRQNMPRVSRLPLHVSWFEKNAENDGDTTSVMEGVLFVRFLPSKFYFEDLSISYTHTYSMIINIS